MTAAKGRGQEVVDRLSKRSALIFILLALVVVTAYVLIENKAADDRANAAEINLAGRRRMLSQRIGLLASQLLHRHDPQQVAQLADSVEQMATIHASLRQDKDRHAFLSALPLENSSLAPDKVNASIERFLRLGEALAKLPPDSEDYRQSAEELIGLSLGSLLPDLDRLVDLYQAESERRSDTLRYLQACALLATLALLISSGLGVLRPLIGRVRRALDELECSEQALRQAMLENRLILETSDDGIFGVDRSGCIRFANPAAAAMLGSDPARLIGRHHHQGILPTSTGCPICRTLADGETSQITDGWFNRQIETETGETSTAFPVDYSVAPRPDGEGAVISFRDISERQQSEIKLQRFQQRLVDAIEAMDDAFALFDANDRLSLYNLRFTELFPLQGDTVRIGMPFASFIREIAMQGLYAVPAENRENWLTERIEAHRRANGSTEIPYADGRWLRATERHTREGGTVVIWSDVTHLKQALIAADHGSQAKSEFLARMSHELRTPLNAILGFAQVLKTGGKQPLSDDQCEYVDHILHGGRHLLGLINEILDLSSIEAGKLAIELETVELGPLLRESLTLIGPLTANRQIELKVSDADGIALIADRKRLKQVLLNLLSNAIKYNRDRGEVRLEIATTSTLVRLNISDTGRGIPPALAERVFSLFDRLDASHTEGTGIGLAITRRLVELMGGSIGFTSTPEIGTTFWVELPGAHGATGQSEDTTAAAPEEIPLIAHETTAARPADILLTAGLSPGDNELLRLVGTTLRQITLVETNCIKEVAAQIGQTACRAVVADESMLPGILEIYRRDSARPPLIVLASGHGIAHDRLIRHWQQKPLKPREIARHLREILQ